MDSNACEINPGINIVDCPTNLKTDEVSIRIQNDEVSSTFKTTNNWTKQNTKKSAKEGNHPLKRKTSKQQQTSVEVSNKTKIRNNSIISDGKNTKKTAKDGYFPQKKKDRNCLPTSQMVMEAIKVLRKRNGASVEAILEYMESQYRVDAKVAKRYVSRYLKSAVNKAVVEQFSGGVGGRFKLKKAENVTKIGLTSRARDDTRSKIKKAEKASMVGRKSGIDGRSKIKRTQKVAKVGQKLRVNQKKVDVEIK